MFQGIIYPKVVLNIKIQHFYDFQANRGSDIILVLLRNNAILQN